MHLLKDIAIDLIVLLLICGTVAMEVELFGLTGPVTVLWWVLAVYTALMLLLKAGALATARTLRQMNMGQDAVSPNVYRLLYAMNTIALLAGGFWLLAAGWVGIWGLSEAVRARTAVPVSTG